MDLVRVCWFLEEEFERLLKSEGLYGKVTKETVDSWFKDFCGEFEVDGFVVTGDGKYKIIINPRQLFNYIQDLVSIVK